jgi:nucleoside-diphosphate-sugar epimerase
MNLKRVLVTGASGYVGAALIDKLLKDKDVEFIVGIDKENPDELLQELIKNNTNKLIFLKRNLGDRSWQDEVAKHHVNAVIHAAWQIRELYGKKSLQKYLNIDSTRNVFEFVFDKKNKINKLVHFSTIASYGAFQENGFDREFVESDRLRVTDYSYAEEKRISEEMLESDLTSARLKNWEGQIAVVRPAGITGPRGRLGRVKFGLQSALSGSLKGKSNLLYSVVSTLTAFTPVTKYWLRQFVHEDDVVNLVTKLALTHLKNEYNVYNLCPPGEPVLGEDMAKAVGKRALILPPFLIRIAFFFAWHLTLGKIPTSRGGWRTYCFPIRVSGRKISDELNYEYVSETKEAFTRNIGVYSTRYTK